MKIGDEVLLDMATRLAAGDPKYYVAMERRARDQPDANDLGLPAKLLVEHFCVIREAAAQIEAGVIAKRPYDASEAKALEWSPS
ncbi:MAG: hypothetical protein JNK75_00355 [Betaproteobacteria bacterium]|nr:hypothetical protein [Betaproteobacteria bacterium]